jgi:uncharacterized membrane protein (UPF0127 family)
MKCPLFLFLVFLSLLFVAVAPAAAQGLAEDSSEASDPVVFETSRLIISGGGIDGGAREYSFMVELALSTRQRARGLMFRERLADDVGMLFLYDSEDRRHMWMKNTMVPLDMLFFDKNGGITRIEHEARPYSKRPISSGGPAQGVLELAGGTARGLGIVAGDRILHPLLPPADK